MSKTTRALFQTTAAIFAGALATLAPSIAHAEGALGEPNQLILSAERIFGLGFWSAKTDNNGTTTKESGTSASFAWSPGGLAGLAVPYLAPRLAADFSLNGFTLGGSIGYTSSSYSTDSGTGQTRDLPTFTTFAITPRFGYVVPITPSVYFWPRAGITYFNMSSSGSSSTGATTSSDSLSGLAVNLEASFVFSPVPHFGISVTPLADIPLSGTDKSESTSNGMTTSSERDAKVMNLGAAVGLVGFF